MNKITKAVFPVAGSGTRFLPATKAQTKEMILVVDKPAIQYLVEDAAASGIKEIIFVTGRGNTAIEDYFDHSDELEQLLLQKNKPELLEKIRRIENLAKYSYARQPMPLGDGHAVSCAAHLIGDEPALVMFCDTLYDAPIPVGRQVMEVYEKYGVPVVGLSEVAPEEFDKFGMYGGQDLGDGVIKIDQVIEKPKTPADSPSNLAAPGVYIITPEVIKILLEMKEGRSGEIRLADAFGVMLERGMPVYGKKLQGEWLDTGNKLNFLKASIKFGLKDEEINEQLKNFLKDLNKNL